MDFKYGGETAPVASKETPGETAPMASKETAPVPVKKLCQLLVNTLIRYNKIEMGLKNVWLDGIKK